MCAIAKDEERYVDEWIAYHLRLGFDLIYLYDNSRHYDLRDLPAKYAGKVVTFHLPGTRMHLNAYRHFALSRRHHTWVAFIDLDEFIVLKKHSNIKEMLRAHCPSGALSLNWYIFGSSDETEYRPSPVLQRFQRRAANVHSHVKTIARVAHVRGIPSSHFPALLPPAQRIDTNGKILEGPFNPNGPTDVAVIHHYFTKSREEFDDKVMRGVSDRASFRAFEEFEEHDINEVVDSSAWDFARGSV